MTTDEEANGKEFDFKETVDETLDYWHTLRVTNTKSETTRAHGLVYFSNNSHLEREEMQESASEDLNIAENTAENWIDEFEEEGLLEEEGDHLESTAEGEIMEEGLNEYASWIADNHPVTEREYDEAALRGIFDEFNIKADVEELNPDEYVDLDIKDKLHQNVEQTTNTKNSYKEAIKVMNELKGDRLEIFGLFIKYGEEEAADKVENGTYSIETSSGAKTFIRRMEDERDVVESDQNGYELTAKGEKAMEVLENQAEELEYIGEKESTNYFDGLTKA
jgi:predicted transcriptional regulator